MTSSPLYFVAQVRINLDHWTMIWIVSIDIRVMRSVLADAVLVAVTKALDFGLLNPVSILPGAHDVSQSNLPAPAHSEEKACHDKGNDAQANW